MHDIWNPWHGCRKCSEGCQHCYMFFMDSMRGKDGADIYRTKNGFNYTQKTGAEQDDEQVGYELFGKTHCL